jgi:hypothetical protein
MSVITISTAAHKEETMYKQWDICIPGAPDDMKWEVDKTKNNP